MPFQLEDIKESNDFRMSKRGGGHKTSTALTLYQYLQENREQYKAYSVPELVPILENMGINLKKDEKSVVNAVKTFNGSKFQKQHKIQGNPKIAFGYLEGTQIVGLKEELAALE
jgi:hypothetical protein